MTSNPWFYHSFTIVFPTLNPKHLDITVVVPVGHGSPGSPRSPCAPPPLRPGARWPSDAAAAACAPKTTAGRDQPDKLWIIYG